VDPLRVEDTEVAPTPSASVLLLRDDADRLEVLLLERTLRSDFAGGAHVFPGGKVDPRDGQLAPDRWRGPDLAADAGELGLDDPAAALAHRVAAVRETFEEAGVLLAHRADGSPVTTADLAAPGFVAAGAALVDRGPVTDWYAWLDAEDLVLDLDALAFWSWWVTPQGSHRRYDTRFFVALVPDAQRDAAAHDTVEVTATRWLTPDAALAAAAAGEVTIIFPTRCNLADQAVHPRAGEAFAASAAGRCDRRRIEPRLVQVDGQWRVQHPDGGDPQPF
jgi:8-oxo-dGTP pyrophosphatase MutT (NUDIX family)